MNTPMRNIINNSPTVRIQKVVLMNFKSVQYGEIVLDCGRHDVQQGTTSDILGVYGQNGSGKTSLIEALSIIKQLMIGFGVEDSYVSCLSVGASYSKVEITFDLQYDDGKRRKVVYSFKMDAVKNKKYEHRAPSESISDYIDSMMYSEYKVRVFDEIIQMAGDFYGEKIKLQPVLDTTSSEVNNPFLPVSKRKYFLGAENDAVLMEQSVNKRMASKCAKSYLFMDETLETFDKLANESEYVDVLRALRFFALKNFFVIDNKIIGLFGAGLALPLYSDTVGDVIFSDLYACDGDVEEKRELDNALKMSGMPTIIPMAGPFVLECQTFNQIKKQFESMNIVIGQLIPGMQIELRNISETMTKHGEAGVIVELFTVRDEVKMPLRYESDGVKKIVSFLDLIIKAYNQKSTTVAIDEIDSGVFEYLLGEILEVFQEGGRGQFIFTSHNLRPLEVIDKKFLYFTTTNPENRYVRMKNIGKTNNLRNVYYREIVIGEQEEELYRKTQQYKISSAFRRAGRIDG